MHRPPMIPRPRPRPGSAALALAGLLTLAACAPKPAADQTVLKIASQKGGTRSLMLAAGVLGGAPYRVEWSEFPSAQALLEAVAAGAVDLGATADAPFMFAYAAGAPVRAVAATRSAANGSGVAVLVRAGSPIQSASDLRGKRIATGRGSIGHYLLLRVLDRAGLSPKDVSIVFMSPGDARAAWASGAVDAWATWSPYVGLAVLHDHARVVADGRGLLHGVGFEIASQGAIAPHRAALADFLHRLAQAQRWEATHTDVYAKVLAKETGLPLDVAQDTVSRARGVPVPIDAAVRDEARATLAEYQKAGVITTAPDIDGAFDPSFNAATGP